MDHYEINARFEKVPSGMDALRFMADVLEAFERADTEDGVEWTDELYPILDRYHDRYMAFHPGHLIGATDEQNRAYQNREPKREINRAKKREAFLRASTPSRMMVGRSAQSLLDEEANAVDEYGR